MEQFSESADIDISDQKQPVDGISILPLLDGKMERRPKGIGFWHPEGGRILSATRVAWIDNQYKLYKLGDDKFELYDVNADVSEKTDIAADHPEVVKRMQADMQAWQQSVVRSYHGEDYPKEKANEGENPKVK
jgi:arylsulfatase A-like enzyme